MNYAENSLASSSNGKSQWKMKHTWGTEQKPRRRNSGYYLLDQSRPHFHAAAFYGHRQTMIYDATGHL